MIGEVSVGKVIREVPIPAGHEGKVPIDKAVESGLGRCANEPVQHQVTDPTSGCGKLFRGPVPRMLDPRGGPGKGTL